MYKSDFTHERSLNFITCLQTALNITAYLNNYQDCDKLCEVHHTVQIFLWYASTLNGNNVLTSQVVHKHFYVVIT